MRDVNAIEWNPVGGQGACRGGGWIGTRDGGRRERKINAALSGSPIRQHFFLCLSLPLSACLVLAPTTTISFLQLAPTLSCSDDSLRACGVISDMRPMVVPFTIAAVYSDLERFRLAHARAPNTPPPTDQLFPCCPSPNNCKVVYKELINHVYLFVHFNVETIRHLVILWNTEVKEKRKEKTI